MSNWDDWIFVFEDGPPEAPKKVYLCFCLNCGKNDRVKGPRYKVWEVEGQALLVQRTDTFECSFCQFPLYSSANYTQLTKHWPIPIEERLGNKVEKTNKAKDRKQKRYR